MSKQILFTNISELITNQGVASRNGVHVTEEDLGIIRDGALLWDSVKGILWMGPTRSISRSNTKSRKRVSLKNKILAPALVDCHTHMVYAGSRHHELALRLSGATYQQIAAAGGGIASTVAATRAASEAELFKLACERIEQAMKLGIGIFEIKSGYGLDWPTERKMLRVIAKLKKAYRGRLIIQSTFLGAHAFPSEAKTPIGRRQHLDTLVEQMIPTVAREKLADACDVFFDEGYFTLEESRRILTTAKAHGLKIKLHADELANTGGASLAAELEALSADHLLKADDHGITQLAKRGVVAVLLPTTALYLGIGYAPAQKMCQAGVCIALSTDYNPGSSPTLHLPFVMSLACLQMGLTMPQAFAAATYGGARALGLHQSQGWLSLGQKPKLAIFNCPSYQALINQVAHPNLCEQVL